MNTSAQTEMKCPFCSYPVLSSSQELCTECGEQLQREKGWVSERQSELFWEKYWWPVLLCDLMIAFLGYEILRYAELELPLNAVEKWALLTIWIVMLLVGTTRHRLKGIVPCAIAVMVCTVLFYSYVLSGYALAVGIIALCGLISCTLGSLVRTACLRHSKWAQSR